MEKNQQQQSFETLLDESVPLKFPSILINPKLSHLSRQLDFKRRISNNFNLSSSSRTVGGIKGSLDRPGPIGRRRQQRAENANFLSNPHVTRPSARDFQLWESDQDLSFPSPPPIGYESSLLVPSLESIPSDPLSSSMGAFNRSLRGVRRNLRRLINTDPNQEPGLIESFLIKVDFILSDWVSLKPQMFFNKPLGSNDRVDDGKLVESNHRLDQSKLDLIKTITREKGTLIQDEFSEPLVIELTRSPHMLSWEVPNPFGRYLVHCVARYHRIVSYTRQTNSNDRSGTGVGDHRKVICMVKAHYPTRRGRRVDGYESLDTPPYTDIDSELSGPEAGILDSIQPQTDGEEEEESLVDESEDLSFNAQAEITGETIKPTTKREASMVERGDDQQSICSSIREDDDRLSAISDNNQSSPQPNEPSSQLLHRTLSSSSTTSSGRVGEDGSEECDKSQFKRRAMTKKGNCSKKIGNVHQSYHLNQINLIDWIRS
ncbi:hypothetical protein BY996DRAFT_7192368 [Phakopsora pachyrhizi]|uniref:R3H domain-containing protein n=1 Tax=Phakopsora pachyrhizi TaxID=170000 RepID=A0AAV0BR46_PHAPC|nr:hypothetical protein BY996DRAFT_7725678 [Phakopsora pachyrhizi]KAI8452940.1 hypothetical protein BY996DRAFT_7192368 [Phakopsora pachyrhizi]CAH7688841.1 hypothetical protein PPACK8108_LOCUS23874 [Phakopsora pachyrhizi]